MVGLPARGKSYIARKITRCVCPQDSGDFTLLYAEFRLFQVSELGRRSACHFQRGRLSASSSGVSAEQQFLRSWYSNFGSSWKSAWKQMQSLVAFATRE